MNHHFPSLPNIHFLFFWQKTLVFLGIAAPRKTRVYTPCTWKHLAFSRKKHTMKESSTVAISAMWPWELLRKSCGPALTNQSITHQCLFREGQYIIRMSKMLSQNQTLTEVIYYSEKRRGYISRIYQETTGCGMV